MLKLDLHTHSIASPDGGITEEEYEEIIAKRILDVVAITDHNRIDFAKKLQKKLGDKIIVGEEIMTTEGEIIGLFLIDEVKPQQSVDKTIQSIHKQGGLVYVPHPFDKARHGIGEKNLIQNFSKIDIIEGFNGRMVARWKNTSAQKFARKYNLPLGVGSDAHSVKGLGKPYVLVEKVNVKTLKQELFDAHFSFKYQPILEYIKPKLNKLKNNFSS